MLRIISAVFLSIIALFITTTGIPVLAETEDAESWTTIPLPVEGKNSNWAIARGSGLGCLEQTSDGTLYCFAAPAGTPYRLFKSTDGGIGWSYTGNVKDTIVDIASVPGSPDIVYYATTSSIYKSTDAGATFFSFQFQPGGTGTGSESITAIDAVDISDHNLIAASIKGSTGFSGGVYLYDESDPDPLTGWNDTAIGAYDIYDLAFSPETIAGRWHLSALVNDGTTTIVRTMIEDSAWGSLISDTTLLSGPIVSGCIAFPDNYGASQSDFTIFAGINTGTDNGDLFAAYGGVAPAASSYAAFNISRAGTSHVDVGAVAVSGDSRNALIVAGAADCGSVYSSKDGGAAWTCSSKPPPGTSVNSLSFAKDFSTTGVIYAGTSGSGAGFSVSTNYGITWAERSFIDAQITALVDFAVSPGYDNDNTIFLLAFDGISGKHSLWRTKDGGSTWAVIFGSSVPGVDSIDFIRLSPEYGRNGSVLFLGGTSGGQSVIWQSADGGSNFTPARPTWDPDSGQPFSPMQCAVIDNSTLVLGTYNGLNGLVYISRNAGRSYSSGAHIDSALPLPYSIAVSPDYAMDKTILIGDQAGSVFISTDGGNSFNPLLYSAPAELSGRVSVAFDPQFSQNRNIYAAGDSAGCGIFRFVIGHSADWLKIDSTLPAGAMINQIALSDNGVLYAADSKAGTGIERALSPRSSGAVFETITRNLDSKAKLNSLSVCGDRVWTLDTQNTRLTTISDTLASGVQLSGPADQAVGGAVQNITLDWEPLAGATLYEWQIDTDSGLTTIPSDFTDTTQSTSTHLPTLEPGTTYYWRVRAAGPVLSPWSEKRSFTTALSGSVDSPKLNSPAFGAEVPVKPVFQWDPIAGATGYELLIDVSSDFSSPVVNKTGDQAISTTAWQSDLSLNSGTSYYWKIRALNSRSISEWSNVGVFTTLQAVSTTTQTTQPLLEKMAEINTGAVTTTVTITQPPIAASPAVTTQLIQVQQTSPDWLKPFIYAAGAFIGVLLILIVLLVMVLLRRN